jgi:PAS domain S-box-containing protein
MQEIRRAVGGLEERTATDRARRTEVLDATARQTRTFALLGGLLGLVAIAAGAWSILFELAARERAESRSRELSARLQDLYDNAPVGYHSLDADGVFVRINRTELEWLRRTADEVVGKVRFSDLLAPAAKAGFERAFERFKAEGTARDVEYDLLRADGSVLPILLNASAVYDTAGAFVTSRGVSIDLTERRRMEAQVKTLRGLLPICANCKKIRDDRGYWNQIESYVREHSEAEFSHGICPECAAKLYPDFVEQP